MTQPPAETTFEAAADLVTRGGVTPPPSALLRLYGLYAVATRGPAAAATPPPPLWDVRARAKHGAYAAASAEGLSVDTARAAYVALVATLPRGGGGSGGGGAAGGEAKPPPPTGLGAKGSTGFVVGATEAPGATEAAAGATGGEAGGPPAAGSGTPPAPPPQQPPSPPIDLGHWAALGDTASARYVLEGHPTAAAAAAAVNTPDEEGLTPLMRAADRGHGAMVALLLAAGADPAAVDGEGWTALAYAGDCGWPDVAGALVAAGARVADAGGGGVAGWDDDVRRAVAAAERGEWPPVEGGEGETAVAPVPRLRYGRRGAGGGSWRRRLFRRLLWSRQAVAHAVVVGAFFIFSRRRRRRD